jgi:hypothetical protein
MLLRRTLTASIALTLLVGCSPKLGETLTASETWPEAAFEIESAAVEGDELVVRVQFGGGCAEHALTVESAGPLLKSLPPKQPLRVVHRTPGDPCRALIQEELRIDLKPWRGVPRGVTVILLENWNEPLTYDHD